MAAGANEIANAAALGTLGTAINTAVLIDADGGTQTVQAGQVIAQPGSSKRPTPITVSDAVTACSGGDNAGSDYGVAWKYF